MKTTRDIDVDLARSLFNYNPDTGAITWKVSPGGKGKIGGVAGCRHAAGYVRIKVGGRLVMAHRLAWVLAYGVNPPRDKEVDHENRKRDDNRLCNLRVASRVQNGHNAAVPKKNTSGLKGAHRARDKYLARITVKGVRQSLGMFDTAEEAHQAYMAAARRYLGEFANDGVAR